MLIDGVKYRDTLQIEMFALQFTGTVIKSIPYSLSAMRKLSYCYVEDIQLELSYNWALGTWSMNNKYYNGSETVPVTNSSTCGFLTLVYPNDDRVIVELPLVQLLTQPSNPFALVPGAIQRRTYQYKGAFDFIKSHITFATTPPDAPPFVIPLTVKYRERE